MKNQVFRAVITAGITISLVSCMPVMASSNQVITSGGVSRQLEQTVINAIHKTKDPFRLMEDVQNESEQLPDQEVMQAESSVTESEPEEAAEVEEVETSTVNSSDRQLLAQMAYCEARGEVNGDDDAVEAMRRTVSVVLNRAREWDMSISEVLSQSGQFASYPALLYVEPTDACYKAVDLEMESQIDSKSLFFSRAQVSGTTYNYTYLNHVFSY